jgi:hypothetical protein
MRVNAKQMPVETPLVIPLDPLRELATHEQQLLTG